MMEQLLNKIKEAQTYLIRVKQFDSANVAVRVRDDGTARFFSATVETKDEFQDRGELCDNGPQYFYEASEEVLWSKMWERIRNFRGREQRELTYMMNQLTNAIEFRDRLVTAAGRDFAEELLRQRDEHIHLIGGTPA